MDNVHDINPNTVTAVKVIEELVEVKDSIESIFVVVFINGSPSFSSSGTWAEMCCAATIMANKAMLEGYE